MLDKKSLLPLITALATSSACAHQPKQESKQEVNLCNSTIVTQINDTTHELQNATKDDLLRALGACKEGNQPNGDIVKCERSRPWAIFSINGLESELTGRQAPKIYDPLTNDSPREGVKWYYSKEETGHPILTSYKVCMRSIKK